MREVESPYLDAKEAVAYLRLGSLSALYRLIDEHRLPHGRLGRHYRFDKRELDAFVRGFGSAIEMARFTKKSA
jgi:excisionase family DNA binding protein